MALIEQIGNDYTIALKQGNSNEVSVLRLLKSAIKNKSIELSKELFDDEILPILQSQIKQRRDSIEQYQKGNRPELASYEQSEIEILTKYLPTQLSENEIVKLVNDAIKNTNANSIKDMGKVMGYLIPQIKGKADGSTISQLVKKELEK